MDEHLRHFAENGYAVIERALSAEEVDWVNAGIDADTAANPKEWEPGSRPGHVAVGCRAPELMHRTDALDGLVHHPSVFPVVEEILGEGALFSSLSFLRREPCLVDAPDDIDDDPLCLSRQWHREYSGIVEGADQNAYFAPGIQVIYYLDDVDETTHCTSIIPESVETKRGLPKTRGGSSRGKDALRIDDGETAYLHPEKRRWMDSFGREGPRRIGRVDVHAPAGSAVMFNLTNYHCGTIRKTGSIRRTVHVMYRQPDPEHSQHALGPDWKSVAAFQSALPERDGVRTR